MTPKQQIIELNRTEDAAGLRRMADYLRDGRLKTRQGVPVLFDYADTAAFFQRCDPTIDAARFEELMQIADSAA